MHFSPYEYEFKLISTVLFLILHFHVSQPLEQWTGYISSASTDIKLISGRDVHLVQEAATNPDWNGDCAMYCSNRTGELVTLPYNAAMPLSLKVLEHEIFTVSPIRVLAPGVSFAPLGLVDMYNAGGAIEELRYEDDLGNGSVGVERLIGAVTTEVKGCGKFGVYSSEKPRRCCVGTNEVDFDYDSASGLVTLSLDRMPEDGQRVQLVEVELQEIGVTWEMRPPIFLYSSSPLS